MTRLGFYASASLGTVLLGIIGCAAGTQRFDELMIEKVRTKAAFDFQCPQEQLNVSKVDSGSYGAVGCGKRASYVGKDGLICWPGNSESNLREYCQVVPDTFAASTADAPPRR
jgi:hypothetical protein